MTNKYFVHIVAVDENNAIGFEDKLLFPISDDLKRFKRLTEGHIVIAGGKTIATLPLLKNRHLICLSRQPNKRPPADGYRIKRNIGKIEEALTGWAESPSRAEPIFIIGGGEVYKSTLEQASIIVMTRIHAKAEKADTWYPDVLSVRPPPYASYGRRQVDPKTGIEFSYITFAYNASHLKDFLKYKAKRDKEYAAAETKKTVGGKS